MITVEIKESNNSKRMTAIFFRDGKKVKTTHFGQRGSSTYIDHNDKSLKTNYIKRHIVNENWDDYMSAGSLSRYILWNKPTLKSSIADYMKMFKLRSY